MALNENPLDLPIMSAFKPYKQPHKTPANTSPHERMSLIESNILLTSTFGLESFHRRIFHSEQELKVRDDRLIKGWCLNNGDGKLNLIGNDLQQLPLLSRRYQCIKLIGEGNFAQIIEAKDIYNINSNHVAIKILNRNATDIGYREAWCMSVLHAKCQGVPAVKLLSTFHFLGHFCLCLELASFSLYDSLNINSTHCSDNNGIISSPSINKSINMTYIKKVIISLLCVIVRLENLGLMHADIKPENILLSNDQESIRILVADFGNYVNLKTESHLYEVEHRSIKDSIVGMSLVDGAYECQSLNYRAPEILLGMKGSVKPKADIWSLAIVIIEMFGGKSSSLLGTTMLPPSSSSLSGMISHDNVISSEKDSSFNNPRSITIHNMIQLFGNLPPSLTEQGLYKDYIPPMETTLNSPSTNIDHHHHHQTSSSSSLLPLSITQELIPSSPNLMQCNEIEIQHRNKIFQLLLNLNHHRKFDVEFGNLLCGMLEMDPDKRLSAKQALAHPFLQSDFPVGCLVNPPSTSKSIPSPFSSSLSSSSSSSSSTPTSTSLSDVSKLSIKVEDLSNKRSGGGRIKLIKSPIKDNNEVATVNHKKSRIKLTKTPTKQDNNEINNSDNVEVKVEVEESMDVTTIKSADNNDEDDEEDDKDEDYVDVDDVDEDDNSKRRKDVFNFDDTDEDDTEDDESCLITHVLPSRSVRKEVEKATSLEDTSSTSSPSLLNNEEDHTKKRIRLARKVDDTPYWAKRGGQLTHDEEQELETGL